MILGWYFVDVNLVLFEPDELGAPLPRCDRRAEHVLRVLRRNVGESFDAGVVNGPRGKATITAITREGVAFSFAPVVAPPARPSLTLVVGLPRPQTARDVLRDATTVGVGALHFVTTDKAERSYAQSTLWSSGEWRRQVLVGAEQAFDTAVPDVTHGRPLAELIGALEPGTTRIALDNYESAQPLADLPLAPGSAVVLAIGSERGWSAAERELLRGAGFAFAHLGARVLRTETAVVAALTLVRAKLGLG